MESKTFAEVVKNRRSYYSLSKDIQVSEDRISEIVGESLKFSPTSFNSQSARVIILFGHHHDKFWADSIEIMRKNYAEDKFPATEARLRNFAKAYGTVLFFEDEQTIKAYQEKFPMYADRLPTFSEQSSGITQYLVWAALEAEGLGANLQHVNPSVDEMVQKKFGAPTSWKLMAQLVFGHPTQPAGDKDFIPIEERMKVFKSNQQ